MTTGAKECVEQAKSRIEDIVADLEQQVTIDCIIPQKFHRTLMGSKGVRVQAITTEHDVKIKFPEKSVASTDGEGAQSNGQATESETTPEGHKLCDIIRITGTSAYTYLGNLIFINKHFRPARQMRKC